LRAATVTRPATRSVTRPPARCAPVG
jgi:hypothetical protein